MRSTTSKVSRGGVISSGGPLSKVATVQKCWLIGSDALQNPDVLSPTARLRLVGTSPNRLVIFPVESAMCVPPQVSVVVHPAEELNGCALPDAPTMTMSLDVIARRW